MSLNPTPHPASRAAPSGLWPLKNEPDASQVPDHHVYPPNYHLLPDKRVPDPHIKEGPSSSADTSSPYVDGRFTSWTLDFLALLASIACIAGLLILILRYDGKPVPNWDGITINALISVLGGVSKAMLAFVLTNAFGQLKWLWFRERGKPRPINDYQIFSDAGTGPLGCFQMLIRVRMWWNLCSLGALLTILMVAINPFLQQIPTYPSRIVFSNETATVSRGTSYAGTRPYEIGLVQSGSFQTLNSEMKGSFYSGLFNSTESSFGLRTVCPGGDCTWDPFTTLGFCSVCKDIESLLIEPERRTPAYNFWKLPNVKNWAFNPQQSKAVFDQRNESLSFSALDKYSIANILVLWSFSTTGSGGSPAGAHECNLYLCVRTYSARVTAGRLEETLLSSWPTNTTDPAEVNAGIMYPVANISSIAIPGRENRTAGNITIKPPGSDPSESYRVDALTFALTRDWVRDTLDDSISYGGTKRPNDTIGAFFDEVSYPRCSNGTCRPDAMMGRIADAMTNRIRASGSEVALGRGQRVETYVEARWKWAILPIGLLALTVVFFAATVVQNARRRLPVWKDSNLPLMAYGLGQEAKEDFVQVGPGLKGMEDAARTKRMALGREGGRYTLLVVDEVGLRRRDLR